MTSRRETALAALFFLAATALFTWPMAPRAGTGLADLWDAKLNAWILHWDFHQVFRDPLHLFDANIFYPSRYTLAFSENLFGASLFAFPLFAAGLSTLVVYNAVFLLGMFLSAMAAWALARHVTGDALAAVAAGVVYAFCPWRIAQIPHIQFQWGAFLALATLFLLRYLDEGRRRDVILFGISFAWNALCNVHYALFSGFLIATVLLYEGLRAGWTVARRRLPAVLAAMAIGGIFVVPFLIPYALASKLYGMQRGIEEIRVFSGVPTDFLTAGGQNRLYAPLTEKWAKAEGELFPGLVPVALAVAALWRRKRTEAGGERRENTPSRRRAARVIDFLFLAAVLLTGAAIAGLTAIGPLKIRDPGRILVFATLLLFLRLVLAFPRRSRFRDLGDLLGRLRFGPRRGLFLFLAIVGAVVALGFHTPYYRFLVESFGPIFRVIRAPVRGVVLFDLGLGVLAAWGLAGLLAGRRPAARFAIAAVAFLAIGFEYRASIHVSGVDPAPAPVHRWLAAASFPGGVAEFPLGVWHDQEHEFRSTAHWKPIVNGASGFSPRSYDELAGVLQQKPIPNSVWAMLAERNGTLVIFHPDQVEGDEAKAYGDLLTSGLKEGRLELVRSFPHGEARDFAFRLTSAPKLDLPAPEAVDPALERRRLDSALQPPFGYLDVPAEGEAAAAGAGGYGWALDDSGIKRVTVTFDQGPPVATHRFAHPGPPTEFPGYPDVANAGFGFTIPALPPGPHVLNVTIYANDGGKIAIGRNFVVK